MRAPLGLVCALLLLAVPAGAEPRASTVVWISMDGVRHDMLDGDQTPALARVAREGGRADALLPIFPSSTFPNHVALATGTHADTHGIVANRFYDPELGFFDYGNDARFLEAEPIWAAAERQGVRAAAFFWVMSETEWRGVGATHRKAPFDGGLGEAEKVDQILAWLDLPEAERPRLIMSWWHGADAEGHRHGGNSEEARAQLAGQDRQLARLLEGIDRRGWWEDLTLILVSDHGMTDADSVLDAGSVLASADVDARVVHAGSVAHVHLEGTEQDGPEQDGAERRAKAIQAFEGIAGVRAAAADAVPESLRYRHPTRTGQVVVLADPPIRLGGTRSRSLEFLRRMTGGGSAGAHGYDPARFPDMHGILLAMGRGVAAQSRFGRPRAIDLAPTVASLLGIGPPGSSEGRAIEGLGPAPRSGATAPRVEAPVP